MSSWLPLVSCPANVPPAHREQLDMLSDMLPIPPTGSPMTRLLAWISQGVTEGLLTDKEGRELKVILGQIV